MPIVFAPGNDEVPLGVDFRILRRPQRLVRILESCSSHRVLAMGRSWKLEASTTRLAVAALDGMDRAVARWGSVAGASSHRVLAIGRSWKLAALVAAERGHPFSCI
ncbi:MAG: hypothetical protein ACR2NU_05085 [Aeoliella sp.]